MTLPDLDVVEPRSFRNPGWRVLLHNSIVITDEQGEVLLVSNQGRQLSR